jgi:hypothetical protein
MLKQNILTGHNPSYIQSTFPTIFLNVFFSFPHLSLPKGFLTILYTECLRSNGKKFKDENYTLVHV